MSAVAKTKPTKSQASALRWLMDHGSTGIFGRDGVLVAGGERAPVMRSTWNALRALGLVERGDKRLIVTQAGAVIGRDAELIGAHLPWDEGDEA